MIAPATLSAVGIRLRYDAGFELDVPALDAVSGGITVLLGPSGSGKSTLLNVLGLLQRPDAGSVLLDASTVTAADAQARLAIAAVFQRPYLFKGTVAANVGYGLSIRRVPREKRVARVAEALEQVGLSGYEDRPAARLSGGEAQRVSLARALVLHPRVLLLDEPLASLDPLLKRRLAREFREILSGSGATAVWVTHDQDEALMVGDRVVVLRAGHVVTHGSSEDVFSLPPDEWTASFLGVETAQRGSIAASEGGLTEIAVGDATVIVSGQAVLGAQVQVAVRPEDVLIFEADAVLPPTTARNRLDAEVVACERRGATDHITLDSAGMRFAASVSRRATAELGLAPGARVVAVFKATAVRWRILDDTQDTKREARV